VVERIILTLLTILTILTRLGRHGLGWSGSGQWQVAIAYEHDNETAVSVKCEEFSD